MAADPPTPAWPLIQAEITASPRPVRFSPADPARGSAAPAAIDRMTERSALGALLLHCGSLVIDDWLSVLAAGGDDAGGGAGDAPGLPEAVRS